jgi:hypothetical protein
LQSGLGTPREIFLQAYAGLVLMRSSRQTGDVRLNEFYREYWRLNETELSKFSEAWHRARAERAQPKLFNRAFGLGGTR